MATIAKIHLEPRKGGRGKLRIMIEPSENGGHVVEHHHDGLFPPKRFVFGKEEGDELLDHVAKHMGIKRKNEDEDEGYGEPEED